MANYARLLLAFIFLFAFPLNGGAEIGGEQQEADLPSLPPVDKLLAHREESHGASRLRFIDNNTLASAGYDGRLVLIGRQKRRGNWRIVKTADAHSGWILSLAFQPLTREIVSGGSDGMLRVWDTDIKKKREAATALGWLSDICLVPEINAAFIVSPKKIIAKWDLETLTPIKQQSGHNRGVYTISCSPKGNLVASGDFEGKLALWDEMLKEVLPPRAVAKRIISLAWISNRDDILAIGDSDGLLSLFSLKNQTILAINKQHSDWIYSLAVSSSGQLIAAGSGRPDNLVTIWNASTMRPLAHLAGATKWLRGLAFSPDERMLAAASGDGYLYFWDIRSLESEKTAPDSSLQ